MSKGEDVGKIISLVGKIITLSVVLAVFVFIIWLIV